MVKRIYSTGGQKNGAKLSLLKDQDLCRYQSICAAPTPLQAICFLAMTRLMNGPNGLPPRFPHF